MIDGNYWPIPDDKIFDGASIAIKNSYRLLKEAKQLGMNDEEIIDYLFVEWITPQEHKRLASHVGLNIRNT
jgi:hypothetical protein